MHPLKFTCTKLSGCFKRIFIKRARKDNQSAKLVLMGAICGDIIGSYYEFATTKNINFELFTPYSKYTDDTICSISIADALLNNQSFVEKLKFWCRKYPRAGYGGMFQSWIYSNNDKPYNSWGNGSAMRVSSIGAYAKSEPEALFLAKRSAEITHNHPEGIKGAQATALAIYLALHKKSKDEIRDRIEAMFLYNLHRSYEEIQNRYMFDVSCQGSVPESIIAFLESSDYESAIRKAVALGGDADTMASITGGIAAAYYGHIPSNILNKCNSLLPEELKLVIQNFNEAILNE